MVHTLNSIIKSMELSVYQQTGLLLTRAREAKRTCKTNLDSYVILWSPNKGQGALLGFKLGGEIPIASVKVRDSDMYC